MLRLTSNMTARRVLADITAANARMTSAQEKLASGKQLNRPSDDPSAVGRAMQLRREQEATKQYQTNVGDAQGWTDVTDSALDSIGDVLARVRDRHPVRLDVYGSGRLWHDEDHSLPDPDVPPWVTFKGDVPSEEIATLMARYGLMLYLAGMLDAFSSATAEALAAGVVVIATGQGSNAEFVRHGWNGFLVPGDAAARPDLDQAERLLRRYLEDPARFRALRRRAIESVPTWDEQAAQWRRVWRGR